MQGIKLGVYTYTLKNIINITNRSFYYIALTIFVYFAFLCIFNKMNLNLHSDVVTKLGHFIVNKKIPNIIFHGPNGCGKNTILSNFIQSIYNHAKPTIKTHVMTVNCAYGRGIRFIREDLKYFAKTNLDTANGEMFKSIVLLNADKLTIDAQSALRRCIELFCHSTRFFIVVEDKNKLLKPILSRFCEIYIPEHTVRGVGVNLHTLCIEKTLGLKKHHTTRLNALKRILAKYNISIAPPLQEPQSYLDLVTISDTLVENGYSALDIIHLLESAASVPGSSSGIGDDSELLKTHELILAFSGVKKEFRNEKLLVLFVLYFIVFRSEMDLKNITFI